MPHSVNDCGCSDVCLTVNDCGCSDVCLTQSMIVGVLIYTEMPECARGGSRSAKCYSAQHVAQDCTFLDSNLSPDRGDGNRVPGGGGGVGGGGWVGSGMQVIVS